MINIEAILKRRPDLFLADFKENENLLSGQFRNKRLLIVGGGGSIGRAVCELVLEFEPSSVDVIDISENSLVELVRTVRTKYPNLRSKFRTFCLDLGSFEFDYFIQKESEYDVVLNFSALKHVRSERDPFTLSRLVAVNILNSCNLYQKLCLNSETKYFVVSTDKASEPVNFMGASKRIMEEFLTSIANDNNLSNISMARFANVAFSDGSILDGFLRRFECMQPLSGPDDISRYFVFKEEAARLCLLSCVSGKSGDIFCPKTNEKLQPINISTIGNRLVKLKGYQPRNYASLDEVKNIEKLIREEMVWPTIFSATDTGGEKELENFYEKSDDVSFNEFKEIAVVKSKRLEISVDFDTFKTEFFNLLGTKQFSRKTCEGLFCKVLNDFSPSKNSNHLDLKA